MKTISDVVNEIVSGNGPRESGCVHVDMVQVVTPSSERGCEDCLKLGDSWVHLRLCLSCGYVGCCDNSKNTHARKHFGAAEHPIIKSFEPGENWVYCYPDDKILSYG